MMLLPKACTVLKRKTKEQKCSPENKTTSVSLDSCKGRSLKEVVIVWSGLVIGERRDLWTGKRKAWGKTGLGKKTSSSELGEKLNLQNTIAECEIIEYDEI